MYKQTWQERMKQLRSNLMIHSYIYYRLGDSIITDEKWQSMAEELVTLQAEKGIHINWYDDLFSDWDGTTGMHIFNDDWVEQKALKLMRDRENRE